MSAATSAFTNNPATEGSSNTAAVGAVIVMQQSTPLTLNGSTSAHSMDDAFHCHNRDGEQEERVKNVDANKRASRVLWLSVGVCLFFMICEVVGGIWAQSLAIITDAAHLLTDLASMLISLFSIYLASRPASQRMSFGWHRAEVLGAFISVFLIWVVTGILVYLAIDRMITAQYDIDARIMSITAAVGVCVNLIMGCLLHYGGGSHGHSHFGSHQSNASNSTEELSRRVRTTDATAESGYQNGDEHLFCVGDSGEEAQPLIQDETERRHSMGGSVTDKNINVRAAFIHVLGDLVQSVGVLFAGLLILWRPNWEVIDPICTLLFSGIVLSTTMYIIRDAMVVLLEGRPSNIDFRLVFDALERIEGVKKVHDLRIWALTMNKVAISVHLEIDANADSQRILRATTQMLRRDFNVHESTIQIEGYQPESENCHQCVVPSK